MINFNKKEIVFIKQIITKLDTTWFKPHNIFSDIIQEDTPWKYPTLNLQKFICEQNGIYLQDNMKKIKYLNRWNATLTLLESRIKLCQQMILNKPSDYNIHNNLYNLTNNNDIFNQIGILTNILDKYINNKEFIWDEETSYNNHALSDGSKLFSFEMIFPDTTKWKLNKNVSSDNKCANCGNPIVIRQSLIEEDEEKYYLDCDSKSRHGGEEIRSGGCISGTRNSNGWIGWFDEIQ